MGLLSAVATGYFGNKSANKAADAQMQAAQLAVEEQRREYDQSRADQAPWLKTGGAALNQLAKLYGIGTDTGKPDYSGFENSPDYQFALQQGQQAIDRRGAAAGNLYSGNTLAAAQQYGQGLATQNYGRYANQLAGLAGIGQNSAQSLGQLGSNAANQIGNQYTNAGNARASGIIAGNAAWQNAANQASNSAQQWGGFFLKNMFGSGGS